MKILLDNVCCSNCRDYNHIKKYCEYLDEKIPNKKGCCIMYEPKVKPIKLSIEESKRFLYNFFHPKENKQLTDIKKSIQVIKTDNGYVAEIEELDLSFLDK